MDVIDKISTEGVLGSRISLRMSFSWSGHTHVYTQTQKNAQLRTLNHHKEGIWRAYGAQTRVTSGSSLSWKEKDGRILSLLSSFDYNRELSLTALFVNVSL